MRRAHLVEAIRQAEGSLMATLPDGLLMQRAATGLSVAVADLLGEVYGARVLLLVGSGSNGGDTLYAGARLARRGAAVSAVLLAPERTHAGGLAAFRAAGGREISTVHDADVALDGIVGIGGSPGLRPDAAEHVAEIERRAIPVVAVDVPSGIGVDDGTLAGPHVRADATVTFGTHKVGLLLGPASAAAGSVHLVDIGLGPYLGDAAVEAWRAADVGARLHRPSRDEHKYLRGVVGIATGSGTYPGAALLSVAGASCGLAGMIRYVGPDELAARVRTHHPEVVGEGRVQSWVVGSGGGDDAAAALERAEKDGVPVVVDADALASVTGTADTPRLLTPHAGELARMLDVDRAEVEADPWRYARSAADRFGAVCLLKGDRTLVVEPEGRAAVNTSGTPWLATAGAGDVLGGLAGALLATGMDVWEAGVAAAWLHGTAARLAAAAGPVTATRVADALPAAIEEALERVTAPLRDGHQ